VKLSRLLENVNVLHIDGEFEADVLSVCYDSRKCGIGSLFVAVSGLDRDGHNYISEAVARGAKFVVHEKNFIPPKGVAAVKVENTRRALGTIGKNFYEHPSSGLCLVGVMGTNGKTTVTYLLESILNNAGCKVGVLGTVNYRYHNKTMPAPNTTPESLEFQRILREMADDGISHVVAEISSHAVDLGRVDDCAFDLGVFTNLSRDHLDYHKNMENYFQAKLRFFKEILHLSGKRRLYKMIINGDDPYGREIMKEAGVPFITFGMSGENDVRPEVISLSRDGIIAKIKSKFGNFSISSSLIGMFNLYNISAAVASAFALEVPVQDIREGIDELTGVPGRLERVRIGNYPAVFVDYAHTDDALKVTLKSLSDLRKGKIITVFGCGGNRDRGKRPLMGKAATLHSDITIITSDNPRGEDPMHIIKEIENGIDSETVKKVLPEELFCKASGKSYVVMPDRKRAIDLAVGIAGPSDMVLIAGKGHENYQIVGDMHFPFDDREAASEALSLKLQKNQQG
jgi:UDP-N-acetylmuramoyl-L-alanyl-D-glutamate--2,6-diaminopimelate ligase